MKIFIGADHAGFEMKNKLVEYLKNIGHDVTDFGAHEKKDRDDYPDFIIPVAKAVSGNPMSKGIVIGGSGQGEAICANRFTGVRAVVFNGQYKPEDGRDVPDEIFVSRQHNDANILSLGARFLSFEEVLVAVNKWLETPFSGDERHVRRIGKIDGSK